MKTLNEYIRIQESRKPITKQMIRERLSARKSDNSDMIVEGLLSNIAKRLVNKGKKGLKDVNSKTKKASEQVFGKFAQKGKDTLAWMSKASNDLKDNMNKALETGVAKLKDEKARLAYCTALDYMVKARYYMSKAEALSNKYDFPAEWTNKFSKDLSDYKYDELENAVKAMKDELLNT